MNITKVREHAICSHKTILGVSAIKSFLFLLHFFPPFFLSFFLFFFLFSFISFLFVSYAQISQLLNNYLSEQYTYKEKMVS